MNNSSFIKNLQTDDQGNLVKYVVWSTRRQDWASVSKAVRAANGGVDNGTYQVVEEGDLIVSTIFDNSKMEYIRCLFSVKSVSRSDDGSFKDLTVSNVPLLTDLGTMFKSYTPGLDQWLGCVQNPSHGTLPQGIGWDGRYTLYEQRKRERLIRLFSGAPSDISITLTNAGQISSGNKVPTDWREAKQLEHSADVLIPVKINPGTLKLFCVEWSSANRVNVTMLDVDGDVQHGTETRHIKISDDCQKAVIGILNDGGIFGEYVAEWNLFVR